MRRLLWLSLVLAALLAPGCARKPCSEEDEAKGPRVRLDVALETCNRPPVAGLIIPSAVDRRSMVTLDASSSVDPNGDSISFHWTMKSMPDGSRAEISDAASGRTSFIADLVGSYVVELIVSDGELDSETQKITVVARNQDPVAIVGPGFSTSVGATATLDGSASTDPDNDPLTYSWALTKPTRSRAVLDSYTAPRPSFIVDVEGTYVATLTVNDGFTTSPAVTVTVVAGAAGGAPIANAGLDRDRLNVNDVIMLDGTASSDPDGDALTYEWSISGAPPTSTAVLSATNVAQPTIRLDVRGTYVIQLIVADAFYRSTPDTVELTVGGTSQSGVGPSTFDPDKIYMYGTLRESVPNLGLMCDLDDPNGGVSAGFYNAAIHTYSKIRPSDGALIYMTQFTHELRKFAAESLVYDPANNSFMYPPLADGNDMVIPTPPCSETAPEGYLMAFLIHPGNSSIIHKCSASPEWYDAGGGIVPMCKSNAVNDFPIAIDFNGNLLCSETTYDGTSHVSDVPTSPPGDGAPDLHTPRAKPGGGWIAMYGEGGVHDKVSIEPDGTATVLESYSMDFTRYRLPVGDIDRWAHLDGDGNYYRWAWSATVSTPADLVIKWTPTSITTVYDEDTDPECKLHEFFFISGP